MIKIKCIDSKKQHGGENDLIVGKIYNAYEMNERFVINSIKYYKWRFVIVNFNHYLEML